MRKRIASVVVLGLSAAALTAGWGYWSGFGLGGGPSHPVVELDREIHLGKQEVGTTVKPSFTIRNKGARPLVLDEITAGCGCLAVHAQRGSGGSEKVERVEVAPRGKETLTLQFVVTGTHGVQQVKSVRFRTNDPDHPTVEIALIATPVARYFATPAAVTLGTVPVGERVEHEVEIRAFDHRLPPISHVSSSNDRIRVEYHPGKKPANGSPDAKGSVSVGLLRLSTLAPDAVGAVQGTISVFCKTSAAPVLMLAVTGRAAPLLELSPSELLLPRASGSGLLYQGTCVCRSVGSKPLALTVEQAPADVTVHIEDIPDNASLKLVRIDAPRLRARVPASGLTEQVRLTAQVDGRRIPLSLPLVLGPQ